LSWTQEADTRMGRLLRGQQDNIIAQTKLANAEAILKKQNGDQCAKAGKVVMNFVKGDTLAFIGLVITGWRQMARKGRWEGEIREEYGARLKDLEDNLAKVKAGQISKCECVILRKIQGQNVALLGSIYDIWRKDVEEAAFQRENGDKIKALEEKLASTQQSQKDSAKKVMAGMASRSTAGLLAAVMKAWIELREDSIKQKAAQEDRLNRQKGIDDFAKAHSEKCKYVIMKFAKQNDGVLVKECFENWSDFTTEGKQEAEMAEKMHNAKSRNGTFMEKNKASSGSVMNRAAEHQKSMLLTTCMNAWRLDSTMEKSVRGFHTKIDAKRGQLVGVQQMFRNFAKQLETGLQDGDKKDSARLFDSKKDAKKMPTKGDQGSVSLPDIKKNSSPNSQMASGRSGGGKVSSKQASNRSNPAAQGEAKVAWG